MTNSWNGQLEGCSISSSKLKESLFFFLEYLQKMKKRYQRNMPMVFLSGEFILFGLSKPFSWLVVKGRIIEARILLLFLDNASPLNELWIFSEKDPYSTLDSVHILKKMSHTVCIMYIRYSRHEDTYILKEMK